MNRHLPMKYIVYKICIDNLISSIEWNECFINFRIVAVYNSALFICLHIHATLVKTEYEKKKGAQALAQKHTNEKKRRRRVNWLISSHPLSHVYTGRLSSVAQHIHSTEAYATFRRIVLQIVLTIHYQY